LRRRAFIAGLGGLALARPYSAVAQSKVQKVGIFAPQSSDDAEWMLRLNAFKKGLRELGWEEGKNFAFDMRNVTSKSDQFSAAAADLVAAQVDVIVTVSAGLAEVLSKVTRTIPIVTMSAGDLEGSGLVASLRQPGGNVTGIQLLSPELMSKRMDLMRQMVPSLSRLGFIEPITPSGIITARYIEVTLEAARALQIEVSRVEIRKMDDLAAAFASIAERGCQAAILVSNPLSNILRNDIVKAAAQAKMPTHYENRRFVDAGGLIAYGPDLVSLAADASKYVDKILKGASPAELPIQQPTKFELTLNLKAADALGIKVPPTLLAQADDVIE
jgi:putative tryptophan/tyrosine transport system substrate-binding protein